MLLRIGSRDRKAPPGWAGVDVIQTGQRVSARAIQMSGNVRKTPLGLNKIAFKQGLARSNVWPWAEYRVSTVMAIASQSILARIDGWGITAPNLQAALSDIVARAKDGTPFTVFTMNLDHLVKLRRSGDFRHAYRNANIVTADGAPVAWLARWQDRSIVRATGADLILPLADAAAEARLPVFLFGTSASVMARAGRELSDRTDGLIDIAGTLAPSAVFDPQGAEADAAIEKIKASGAKLCFVALGAPKQEIFAERAREKGVACGFICIGAAIDFIAKEQIRAPEAMRNSGLEWLWRLASNPRRFAKRYADCAAVLFDLTVVAPMRARWPRTRGS